MLHGTLRIGLANARLDYDNLVFLQVSMAKRLDWEKEAKRLKLIRRGFLPLWDEMRIPTGSRAQNSAIAKELRKSAKKRKKSLTSEISSQKQVRSVKIKVFRRRDGEGIIPVRKK